MLFYREKHEDWAFHKNSIRMKRWVYQCARLQNQYTKKSIIFVKISNKQSKSKVKKRIPFTITSQTIKYFSNKLNQSSENLYIENYKTFWNKLGKISKSMGRLSMFMRCCLDGSTPKMDL